MAYTIASGTEHEAIYEWLRNKARELHIEAKFHTERVKQYQNWLYIPSFVEGDNALIKANALQAIEDAWRNQEPEPKWEMLLIPTAN